MTFVCTIRGDIGLDFFIITRFFCNHKLTIGIIIFGQPFGWLPRKLWNRGVKRAYLILAELCVFWVLNSTNMVTNIIKKKKKRGKGGSILHF